VHRCSASDHCTLQPLDKNARLLAEHISQLLQLARVTLCSGSSRLAAQVCPRYFPPFIPTFDNGLPTFQSNIRCIYESFIGLHQRVRTCCFLACCRVNSRTWSIEIERLIRGTVDQVIKTSSFPSHLHQAATELLLSEVETTGSYWETYNATGRLVLREHEDNGNPLGKLITQVKEVSQEINGYDVSISRYSELATRPSRARRMARAFNSCGCTSDERQLLSYFRSMAPNHIHFQINAAARLRLLPPTLIPKHKKSHSLYAGQPISAILSIDTSLHWGTEQSGNSYMLRFDVEEMVRDWLVSGPKRGDFMAKVCVTIFILFYTLNQCQDGETFSVPVTLVALHHGELSLPRISVTPLPMTGSFTMGGSMAIPSIDTYQVHGAERVLILPRGGRSTFVIGMGHDYQQ
jgi:trafficking protein particle complex subunit 10